MLTSLTAASERIQKTLDLVVIAKENKDGATFIQPEYGTKRQSRPHFPKAGGVKLS
jgi:hypothetical protein